MREYLIAGNWKMNTTVEQAGNLADKIREGISAITFKERVRVAVFPPFVNIAVVAEKLKGSGIGIGAQNCSNQPYGAFTGEVSIEMLQAIHSDYVLIGHSERRKIFRETNEVIYEKVALTLKTSVKPILCIGETLEQRQTGQTWGILAKQLDAVFTAISDDDKRRLIVAYEPVWAIGTGLSATPEEAEEAHAFIQSHVRSGVRITDGIPPILYGGSVSAENATSLLSRPGIDGVLVGNASLKAESFISIIQQAVNLSES